MNKNFTLPNTLLGITFGWLLYVQLGTFLPPVVAASGQPATQDAATQNNELISIKLVGVDALVARLEVEYSYNGAKGPDAWLFLEVPLEGVSPGDLDSMPALTARLLKGRNKVVARLTRQTNITTKFQTQVVKVTMKDERGEELTSKTFNQVINWPSRDPFVLNSTEPSEIERVYKLCVDTIDSAYNMDEAKRGLEQIVLADPEYLLAYPELARYHMKTSWNPAGLGQAERALKTGLRIDPNHANSLVLLGYVYTHQLRYKEAEETFRRAEKIGTSNIWLYANLGELYAKQEDKPRAIEAYRKAVTAPETLKTYERGRVDAYKKLLFILTYEKQWKQAEELHAQRVAKFPDNACYKAEHADFRLRMFGDYEGAIAIGTKALEQGCADNARPVLGMAYFTKWAAVSKSGKTREAAQHFNRGQALYANVPGLLWGLAASEHTAGVISDLKRHGIDIDTRDRNGMTALGISIANGDANAGEVLIRHGANVNQQITSEGFTLLMLAAVNGNREFVSLLLKNGADPTARMRSGYGAETFAKERGFHDIADLIARKPGI